MSQSKYTPLPWKISKNEANWDSNIIYDALNPIAECNGIMLNAEENAQFIIRACNSHYNLLEACKKSLYDCEHAGPRSDSPNLPDDTILMLKQAIKKAEGEA